MKLEIPDGDFGGYIFDLDGTLVDTMPLHYRAWDEAMREVGLNAPLDEELFYSLGGVPTKRVAELIAAHYGLKIDPHAVFDRKEALFLELGAQGVEHVPASFDNGIGHARLGAVLEDVTDVVLITDYVKHDVQAVLRNKKADI